jgi:hypothetical protein
MTTSPTPTSSTTRSRPCPSPSWRRAARVVADELGKLEAFSRRTQRQEAHRGALAEEFAAIVLAIGEHDIKRAQDRETLRVRSGNLGNVEHADGEATSRPYSGVTRRRGSPDPTVIVRAAQRSHGDLDRVERFTGFNSDEMLRRADHSLNVLRHQGVPDEGLDKLGDLLEAIEDEPATQALTRRSNAAELVLAGSDPVYRTAFRKWMRNPESWRNDLTSEEFAAVQRTRNAHRQIIGDDWRDGETLSVGDRRDGQYAQRAALSLTGANGGFLVPLTLDPSIMLQNVGSANPYRRIARIVQTSTNTWQGVNSTGMNAQWLAENTAAADATPTFAQTILTPLKAAAWSVRLGRAAHGQRLRLQLMDLLADAKDRLEESRIRDRRPARRCRSARSPGQRRLATRRRHDHRRGCDRPAPGASRPGSGSTGRPHGSATSPRSTCSATCRSTRTARRSSRATPCRCSASRCTSRRRWTARSPSVATRC